MGQEHEKNDGGTSASQAKQSNIIFGVGTAAANIKFGNPSQQCLGNGICNIAGGIESGQQYVPCELKLNLGYQNTVSGISQLDCMTTSMSVLIESPNLATLQNENPDLYQTLMNGTLVFPGVNTKPVSIEDPQLIQELFQNIPNNIFNRVSIPPNWGPWPLFRESVIPPGGGDPIDMIYIFTTVMLHVF